MYIDFTDEENKYIIKEPFNWHVSEDAPDEIRKSIEKKLNLVNSQSDKIMARRRA